MRKNEQESHIHLGGTNDGEDEGQDYHEEDQDSEIDSRSQSQSPNVKVRNNSERTRSEIAGKNGLDADTSAQRPRRNTRRG